MQHLSGAVLVARTLSGLAVTARRCQRHSWARRDAQADLRRRAADVLRRAGITVEIIGEDGLPEGGAVVVYNESSWPDMCAQHLLLGRCIDRQVVAGELARLPFVRRNADTMGLDLLPRGDRAGVDRVLEDLAAAASRGERILFGGEGGMSGIDGVKRFKSGAALLAIRAQRPLVPVAFQGAHDCMPWGGIAVRPGIVRIGFAARLAVDGLDDVDARDLADRAQEAVQATYQELQSQ